MEKLIEFVQEKISPIAGKLASQKYLHALTNTFMTLMPIMTIGAFALIIADPPIGEMLEAGGVLGAFAQGWSNFAVATFPIFATLYNVCLGLMAVYVAIGMGYFLSKHYKINSLLPTFITFVSFMIVAMTREDWSMPTEFLGSSGIFPALITSILSFELYRVLCEKKFGYINLGEFGVPPAIADSIGNLFPAMVTMFAVAVVSGGVYIITGVLIPEIIGIIMAPIAGIVGSWWGTGLLAGLVQLDWWFGIHDAVITSPMEVFWTTAFAENLAAYQAGTEIPNIVTSPFWWMFVIGFLNVSLAVHCLLSKSKHLKTVGKIGIIPSIFNISEPFLFGLPIVFNASLLIPFLLIMPVNAIMSYAAMALGFIGKTIVNPSWNMPVFIGQFLSNLDPRTFIFSIIMFAVDFLIWLPFIKAFEREKLAEEAEGEVDED